jgi:hypothetical protein
VRATTVNHPPEHGDPRRYASRKFLTWRPLPWRTRPQWRRSLTCSENSASAKPSSLTMGTFSRENFLWVYFDQINICFQPLARSDHEKRLPQTHQANGRWRSQLSAVQLRLWTVFVCAQPLPTSPQIDARLIFTHNTIYFNNRWSTLIVVKIQEIRSGRARSLFPNDCRKSIMPTACLKFLMYLFTTLRSPGKLSSISEGPPPKRLIIFIFVNC